MNEYVPWNSQPLDLWSNKYAEGISVDLSGRRTHYLDQGEGNPVILIHGFFYDACIWGANLTALARHFKVYAPDLWGFGYSTREPLDYNYTLFADQLRQFIDHLGLERVSLVGQSMGGGTAIRFCIDHPERVDKLILVDSTGVPHPMPVTGKIFNIPKVGEFLLGLKSDVVRRKNLGDFWIHNKRMLTENYFNQVTRFQKIKGTTEVLMTILRKDFFHTLEEEIKCLGEMDIPVLIVWGREDRAIPLYRGQQMHQMIKRSWLKIINDAGHVPNYEDAVAFNSMAIEFLQS